MPLIQHSSMAQRSRPFLVSVEIETPHFPMVQSCERTTISAYCANPSSLEENNAMWAYPCPWRISATPDAVLPGR